MLYASKFCSPWVAASFSGLRPHCYCDHILSVMRPQGILHAHKKQALYELPVLKTMEIPSRAFAGPSRHQPLEVQSWVVAAHCCLCDS